MRKHFGPALLAIPAALALAFAACGGDGGGGLGTDEEYVDDLCGAFQSLQENMDGLFEDLSGEADEQKVAEAFAEPFEEFLNELKKARPPADVKPYHDELVDSFEQTVKAIKDGDMNALDNTDDVSDPPEDIQARLEKAAENNKTCQEVDFGF